MAPTQKVRVDVQKLLSALKERKVQMTLNHKKAETKYEADLEKYSEAVKTAVNKMADRIKSGQLPESDYRGHIVLPVRMDKPSKPRLDTVQLDKQIRVLEMSDEDAILIAHDSEYSKYL